MEVSTHRGPWALLSDLPTAVFFYTLTPYSPSHTVPTYPGWVEFWECLVGPGGIMPTEPYHPVWASLLD